MKTLFIGCIACLLYTQVATAGEPASKYKMTVSLESKQVNDAVDLVLINDQVGVYHHFILEKSLDGKLFTEISRADEKKEQDGASQIVFTDFPFQKSAMSCVFYRIRAVDELGWFDFTNTVTVMRKQDLATKEPPTGKGKQLVNNQF